MAQFIGTGKDPRFPKGQPFDIPDGDPEQQKLVEKNGHGVRSKLVGQVGPEDPAKRVVEVADADLRGDPLNHPQDAALAESLSEDEEREIDAEHSPGGVGKRQANKATKAADEHPPEGGAATERPKAGTEGQSKSGSSSGSSKSKS